MNNKAGLIAALIIAVLVGWVSGTSKSSLQMSGNESSPKAQALKLDMRKLWDDHVVWTRMWIISEANNASSGEADAARLLKNQEDIGNAIKPYYGEEAGDKLTTLLKTHITTAVELVKAAKAGDNAAMTKANNAWYKNGDEIADFLASANPNWPQETLRSMMKEHLDLTKAEAVSILAKKHAASITDYDKVRDEMLMMSDVLTDGIVMQFPEKF